MWASRIALHPNFASAVQIWLQMIKGVQGVFAAYACVVDVLLDAHAGVQSVATTTVDVAAIPEDPEMRARTEMHNEGVSIMRNEVLIDRSVPWYSRLLLDPPYLSSEGARKRQTTMGLIIASAIIAYNVYGLRLRSW